MPSNSKNAPSIASPCKSICKMNAAGTLCLGCGRNLDEIAEWPSASDERKREILASVEER